jgi:hypothetical protein
MNKVLFLASVLSMTLSSCAIADYEWEGYNSRLLENSEIRDLSSDACSELETASVDSA